MTAPSPIPVAPEPPAAHALPSSTPAPQPVQPSIAELFIAFATISLSGFGGVLAWSRRMMVEERKWLTAEQFNESLCAVRVPARAQYSQFLGRCSESRFRGPLGGAGRLRRADGSADDPGDLHRRDLRPLWRSAGAAPHADRRRLGRRRPDDGDGRQDGAAAVPQPRRRSARSSRSRPSWRSASCIGRCRWCWR